MQSVKYLVGGFWVAILAFSGILSSCKFHSLDQSNSSSLSSDPSPAESAKSASTHYLLTLSLGEDNSHKVPCRDLQEKKSYIQQWYGELADLDAGKIRIKIPRECDYKLTAIAGPKEINKDKAYALFATESKVTIDMIKSGQLSFKLKLKEPDRRELATARGEYYVRPLYYKYDKDFTWHTLLYRVVPRVPNRSLFLRIFDDKKTLTWLLDELKDYGDIEDYEYDALMKTDLDKYKLYFSQSNSCILPLAGRIFMTFAHSSSYDTKGLLFTHELSFRQYPISERINASVSDECMTFQIAAFPKKVSSGSDVKPFPLPWMALDGKNRTAEIIEIAQVDTGKEKSPELLNEERHVLIKTREALNRIAGQYNLSITDTPDFSAGEAVLFVGSVSAHKLSIPVAIEHYNRLELFLHHFGTMIDRTNSGRSPTLRIALFKVPALGKIPDFDKLKTVRVWGEQLEELVR